MFTKTIAGLFLSVSLAVMGCQSEGAAENGTSQPDPSSSIMVTRDYGYFSLDDNLHRFLVFSLRFDQPEKIKTWVVKWKNTEGITEFEMLGTPPLVPSVLTWDGRKQDGSWVEPGLYIAQLTVDYGGTRGQNEFVSEPFTIEQTLGEDAETFRIPVDDEQPQDALE